MTDETDAVDAIGTGPSRERRRSEPLVLAVVGLGVAGVLLVASALPVLLGRDGGESSASGTASTVGSTAAPPPSTAAAPPTTVADTTTAVADTTTTTSSTIPIEELPESVAVVSGGQIVLEGAVPDEAARAEIVELAAGIFGPDNVVDNYVIDERAGDPGLGSIRVDDAVLFAPDSAQISPEFEPLLDQGLALLTIRPAATFVVVGHTDSTSGENYNLELSQARADAVVRWWVDRGVDPARLTAIGRGETEPIDTNETPEGRERNRRIEVTIENLLVEP